MSSPPTTSNRQKRFRTTSTPDKTRGIGYVEISLDGTSLSLDLIYRFLWADDWHVSMAPEATEALTCANEQLRSWVREEVPIYGVTRGLGPLKDKVLSESEEVEFQRRILVSHATGFGDLYPDQIATLTLLLRANAACQGHFGIRPELVQRMLDLINADVIPQMPIYGSLGSGDLQPMASLALLMTGDPHGIGKWNGETGPAAEILERAGLEPHFPLETLEALSIISGSTVLAAGAAVAFARINRQLDLLDGAYAVTMEALRAEMGALDPRVHEARGIPGQIASADLVRKLLQGSEWTTPEGRRCLGENTPRVQDAVSLRSSAHIHGALRETLGFARTALERELKAATMNPLLFQNEDDARSFDVVMCGNYDGSFLAHLIDYLNIALTDCAGLSMTRSARLISPHASYGLPPNLTGGHPGLNSGLVQVHSLQVALVGQMRQEAVPASIHSLSAKDMQEDHNSMGGSSLNSLLLNVGRADTILAGEYLLSTQAIALIEPKMQGLRLGKGTQRVKELISTKIAPPGNDRFFRDDLDIVRKLVREGVLHAAVDDD